MPCPSRDVASTTETALATTLPVATTVAPDTTQPAQTTEPNLTTPPPEAIATTTPVPPQPQIQKATIAVPGNQPWTDTGIDITAGENLYIEGSGTIKIAGSDPGKLTNGVTVGADPNGYCQAPQSFTAPGRQCYGMIARIGADMGSGAWPVPCYRAAEGRRGVRATRTTRSSRHIWV